MKKIISILVLVFVTLGLRAMDLSPGLAFNPVAITLLSASSTSTNAASASAARIDTQLYHTIHIYNLGASNALVTLERSMDSTGTNWVNMGTNTVNSLATYETNFVGKFALIRARSYVTNSALNVLYLGGR